MTATVRTTAAHLTEIPGTGWRVWRDALLRSAGFPADGLDRFAAPDCAAAADAHLAGGDPAAFAAAYEDATRATARAVHAVAADPAFREAVGWQNPGAVDAAAGVLRDGPDAKRDSRRRRREDLIAKYWQRYCAKNDTVGFFGPICWVTLDADGPAVAGGPGPALTRRRTAFFEWWALDALAEVLAADPLVRRELPVALQPHLAVSGGELRSPHRSPTALPPAEAALLARCDGRTRAADLATGLAAAGVGYRRPDDVLAALEQLAERGVVRWDFGLPMNLDAEQVLADRLAAIPEEAVRGPATALFRRLTAARDAVGAADGPEAVGAAMAALEAEFVAVTGREARQRAGATYAGRTLVHLETVRDAAYTLGGPVLAALAPLDPLLRSARWLTGELAAVYDTALTALYDELAAGRGAAVPFGELWFLAQASVFGADKPADAVVDDFCRRWTDVFGLDAVVPGVRRLDLDLAAVAERAAAAFPEAGSGWRGARVHSPDVHVLADGPDALARGEFRLVLGELHMGLAAMDTDFFRIGHPDHDRLRAAYAADVGVGVQPLLPADWPRHCARNADWMARDGEVQLGFAAAPGADPDRLLPVSAATVGPGPDGGLVVTGPDGRGWPLVEVFASWLTLHAFDTWKLAGGREHTPRTSVGGLVLVRETWRTTVGATGLADVAGEAERYLAVRRWRAALGLPERVFVRVGTEVKPCYVDLTSPVYARVLCTLVRGAMQRAGADVTVAVSEMLPTPQDAWVTDVDGRRYCSELRMHLVDGEAG